MAVSVARTVCAITFFTSNVFSQITTISGAQHDSVTTITSDHQSLFRPVLPSDATQLIPSSPCLLGTMHCMISPCSLNSCPSFPSAVCSNDYCGGCFAVYTAADGHSLSFDECHAQPIIPIDPAPIASPPSATDGAIVPGPICPSVGSACTSALLPSDRCCAGGEGGDTECLFDDVDVQGHRLGVCCVRTLSVGCAKASDCCAADAVCAEDGTCQRRGSRASASASAAQSVYANGHAQGHFDELSAEKSGEGASWVRLWVGVIALVVMGGVFAMPLLWCWLYGTQSKAYGEGEAKRVMRYEDAVMNVVSGVGGGGVKGSKAMMSVVDESLSEDEFRDSEDDRLFID